MGDCLEEVWQYTPIRQKSIEYLENVGEVGLFCRTGQAISLLEGYMTIQGFSTLEEE